MGSVGLSKNNSEKTISSACNLVIIHVNDFLPWENQLVNWLLEQKQNQGLQEGVNEEKNHSLGVIDLSAHLRGRGNLIS